MKKKKNHKKSKHTFHPLHKIIAGILSIVGILTLFLIGAVFTGSAQARILIDGHQYIRVWKCITPPHCVHEILYKNGTKSGITPCPKPKPICGWTTVELK